MGCIYLIKCLKNNKVYIGQYKLNEASKRFNRHISDAIKGSKYAIHQAIRKYGKDNFTIVLPLYSSSVPFKKKYKFLPFNRLTT